jgi:hypothetical protein
MKRLLLAAGLVVATLATGSAARAQQPGLTLGPGGERTGWVSLAVTGPAGATVALSEIGADGAPVPVGSVTLGSDGRGELVRAAPWRCAPRERAFRAEAADAAGQPLSAQALVTTPRCRDRFALRVRPGHPRAGRPLTVLLLDRWRSGAPPVRACAHGPAGVRRCGELALAAGSARAAWRLRPSRPGTWRVEVRPDAAPVRRATIHVRPRSGRLRLLATGDSMIQIVDGFLKARLAPAAVDVRSDARISTGITKPSMLDWPAHARAQARDLHPDVTAVFLGANDGFPLRTSSGAQAPCCGRAWVRAYAKRASGMMRSYARRGAGAVYWLLLPAPRGGNFRPVFRAVNAALRRAAARHPGEVHVVDLGRTFTPGGTFRQSIRWHGRTVNVRQADGVHLNVAGASIAATLVIRAMRRDGVI